MARDRLSFRARDLAIVVKTMQAAGLTVAHIDVERGGGFKVFAKEAVTELDETDSDTDPETLAALEAVRNAKI
jgi:hypothetical protein